MSTSFSANQYQNAFTSKKLSNWQEPMTHPERPKTQTGSTDIIANDRGHLTNGVSRSRNNPWGNYVGTWDLPQSIPGNCARVPTARTTYAQEKLQMDTQKANEVLNGEMKNVSRKGMRGTPLPDFVHIGPCPGQCDISPSASLSAPKTANNLGNAYPETPYPNPHIQGHLSQQPPCPFQQGTSYHMEHDM